jgi:hypothetical protein
MRSVTTLEIQYVDNIDRNKKKEKSYDKYKMLPIEKNDRTLRFKSKGMYLQNIEDLLEMDSEIEFINGEAESQKKINILPLIKHLN